LPTLIEFIPRLPSASEANHYLGRLYPTIGPVSEWAVRCWFVILTILGLQSRG
jgi:hypothetical protein